jgi:ribosomal protein S16
LDRVDHWVSVGAQMSDRVRSLVVEARKQSVDEAPTVTTE